MKYKSDDKKQVYSLVNHFKNAERNSLNTAKTQEVKKNGVTFEEGH